MPKADFHIHTTMSDGALTPTQVVKKYKEEEYDIIAITDHDGIDGIREAQIAGEALEITVIGGIEFSTTIRGDDLRSWGVSFDGRLGKGHHAPKPDATGLVVSTDDEIGAHLLGYYINTEDEDLNTTLDAIRKCRYERNLVLIEELGKLGCELTYEELRSGRKNDFIGKPVIARKLAEKGYISNPKEAFEEGKFLEAPSVKMVKKTKVDVLRAISLINNAGGISVLAHPMKIKNIGERDSEEFWTNLDKILRGLKKNGLKGLECFHTDHTHEEGLRLAEFAEKYHLHITHGSDFHGHDLR